MLRVAVEGLGYIGIVKITDQTTLAGLRSLITSAFDSDSIPLYYIFSDVSNHVVDMKDEPNSLAWDFHPLIKIVPTEEPLVTCKCLPLCTLRVF